MNPKTIVIYLLAIVAPLQAHAVPPALSTEEQKAYETVAKAGHFCNEAVGYAGTTPPVVTAFRLLLKGPHADPAFKRLITEATTAGKLYALCGLYYTDPTFFEKAVQPFRQSRQPVATYMGCMVGQDTVSSIVERPDRGTVRLKSREQSIKEWETATKPAHMYYDIVGGGWPDIFKESGGYPRH